MVSLFQAGLVLLLGFQNLPFCLVTSNVLLALLQAHLLQKRELRRCQALLLSDKEPAAFPAALALLPAGISPTSLLSSRPRDPLNRSTRGLEGPILPGPRRLLRSHDCGSFVFTRCSRSPWIHPPRLGGQGQVWELHPSLLQHSASSALPNPRREH